MNETEMNTGPRISVREVADSLGIPLYKVYRWVRTGRMRAHRTGRRIFIDPEEIAKFRRGANWQLSDERLESEMLSKEELIQPSAAVDSESASQPHMNAGPSRGSGQRELFIRPKTTLGSAFVVFTGFEFLQ